jgi:WD40 repeat protein
VWDATDGKALLTLDLETSPNGGHVVYSPDGKWLAFTSGNHVQIVDAVSGGALLNLAPFDHPAVDVVFAPDGQRIAAASGPGPLCIYDSNTGNLLLEFTESTTGLQQIVFSPDGKRLASASEDGAILWDAATGKKLLTFTGHGKRSRINGIAFGGPPGADGKWVAIARSKSGSCQPLAGKWPSHSGSTAIPVRSIVSPSGALWAPMAHKFLHVAVRPSNP